MNTSINNVRTPIELKKSIGAFLREIRVEKSLTGKQLGKLLNVSQQQISRYERGVSSLTFEKLQEILCVLEVDWNKFISKVFNCNV